MLQIPWAFGVADDELWGFEEIPMALMRTFFARDNGRVLSVLIGDPATLFNKKCFPLLTN